MSSYVLDLPRPAIWLTSDARSKSFSVWSIWNYCLKRCVGLQCTEVHLSITTPWRWDRSGKERLPFRVGGFYTRTGAVQIRGSKIVWERLSTAEPHPRNLPVPFKPKKFELLYDFVALSDGTIHDLCDFAQRHGPLTEIKPMGGEEESIQHWRRWSAFAKAMLSIANKFQDGEPLSRENWAVLGWDAPPAEAKPRPPREHIRSLERFAFVNGMNLTLWSWDVRPQIRWSQDSELRLEMGGRTLLSGIGALLLSAICRSDHPTLCSACGSLYPPSRKPRDGENRFCKKCGKRAARRLAQRRYIQNLKLRQKEKPK